jgi:hypothetical protein
MFLPAPRREKSLPQPYGSEERKEGDRQLLASLCIVFESSTGWASNVPLMRPRIGVNTYGLTYYFCLPQGLKKFDEDPERHTKGSWLGGTDPER